MSDFLPPLMVTCSAALCQQSAVGVLGGIERVCAADQVATWRVVASAGGRAGG